MNFYDMIKELPTKALLELKNTLQHGKLARASVSTYDALKEAENKLTKFKIRWADLVELGLAEEFDKDRDFDFIVNHTDSGWKMFLDISVRTRDKEVERETALAEKTNAMKVPPIVGDNRDAFTVLRDELMARRNNGHG
jgi:hypothetical protein